MTEVDLKEMLEAVVHFGHKKDKRNPKMKPFIYTERNGVDIFDLVKTKEKLEDAIKFVKEVASNGGTILFVGTKNQVKGIIKEEAERCGMPYIADRWPGGMFTNFNTILSRLRFLKDAEEKLEATGSANSAKMTKKEALTLSRELDKLREVFGGVKDVRRLPDAIFVADLVKERIAVREAKKMGIPVIGIADTNAKPDVDAVIPGNDDAVRSVKYIVGILAETILKNKKEAGAESDSAKASTDKSDTAEASLDKATDSKEVLSNMTKKEEAIEVPENMKDEEVEKLEKLEMKAEEEVVVKKSKTNDEPVKEAAEKGGK